jgi:hypothetical protein
MYCYVYMVFACFKEYFWGTRIRIPHTIMIRMKALTTVVEHAHTYTARKYYIDSLKLCVIYLYPTHEVFKIHFCINNPRKQLSFTHARTRARTHTWLSSHTPKIHTALPRVLITIILPHSYCPPSPDHAHTANSIPSLNQSYQGA